MEDKLIQLETALSELHKSNDITDAAYNTLKFAVFQLACAIRLDIVIKQNIS